MQKILFSLPGNEALGQQLRSTTGIEKGRFTLRRFPDGETYLRMQSDVKGKAVYILSSLPYPDDKIMSLYFLAQLVRESGSHSITLIAPYLCYMRQDKAFHPGEAITSAMFAALISRWFDALITIDPHLHRYGSMDEIYSIPTRVLHVKHHLAQYVKTHIDEPVIIGPDAESKQWAAETAHLAGCGHLVMKKERKGDRDVSISVPGAVDFPGRTPVLVDDIISTGVTMSEAIRHLGETGLASPVCIGIHGIFAKDALEILKRAGAAQVITTNTISHSSNKIDISDIIADAIEG